MLNELYDKFYQYFYSYLISSILINVFLCLILIFRRKYLDRTKYYVISPKFTFWIILTICIVVDIFLLIKLNTGLSDLDAVKEESYESVTGEVIGYKRRAEGNDGLDLYYSPIIQLLDSNETITLEVLNTELGETYTFYYLENTRIAVIAEVDLDD